MGFKTNVSKQYNHINEHMTNRHGFQWNTTWVEMPLVTAYNRNGVSLVMADFGWHQRLQFLLYITILIHHFHNVNSSAIIFV